MIKARILLPSIDQVCPESVVSDHMDALIQHSLPTIEGLEGADAQERLAIFDRQIARQRQECLARFGSLFPSDVDGVESKKRARTGAVIESPLSASLSA